MTELTPVQKSFDSFFDEASNVLSIQVNPKNIDKARREFLKTKKNPELFYQELDDETLRYAHLVLNMSVPKRGGSTAINNLLIDVHRELNERAKMILSFGFP
jgi:hypothetical protein